MHPEVPPPSLPQQVDAVREQLEDAFGESEDRGRRALVAHARSHLTELSRIVAALCAAETSPEGSSLLGDAEWDLVHDEVAWSAEMYRLFARAPQDGPLTLDQLPGALHPEDRHAVSGMLTSALVDGKPIDAEFRLQLGDGSVRAVHCVGAPQIDDAGGVSAVWLALRDLGRRRG